MRYKDQRVGVFVDVQNLYHSAKHLYGARVNFTELIKSIVGPRQLIRAIGYVVKSDISSGETAFFDALENGGIELRMKDLQVFAGGAKKADWDVGMAVDAIRIAPKLDVVVLVTGDGDFAPLVRFLRDSMGCVVEIMAFQKTCSSKLLEEADGFTDLIGSRKFLK